MTIKQNIRNALSRKDLFVLGDFIRQHCKADDEGNAIYDPAWSDILVFEKFRGEGMILTLHNVQGLRVEIVGPLPKSNAAGYLKNQQFAEIQAKLDNLTAGLELVMLWASERPETPFPLENKTV